MQHEKSRKLGTLRWIQTTVGCLIARGWPPRRREWCARVLWGEARDGQPHQRKQAPPAHPLHCVLVRRPPEGGSCHPANGRERGRSDRSSSHNVRGGVQILGLARAQRRRILEVRGGSSLVASCVARKVRPPRSLPGFTPARVAPPAFDSFSEWGRLHWFRTPEPGTPRRPATVSQFATDRRRLDCWPCRGEDFVRLPTALESRRLPRRPA